MNIMEFENQKHSEEYRNIKALMEESIEAENFQEAYSHMRQLLDYPSVSYLDQIWDEILPLFKKILEKLIGKRLNEIIDHLREDPKNVNILYDLGYNLFEEGAYSIAATFLKKANDLQPNNESIITELAITLEALMLNEEAIRILENSPDLLKESELCQYLLAFNKLMTGNIKESKEISEDLYRSSNHDIRVMAESLKGIIKRAESLKKKGFLDKNNLRGWHLVLNGTILLHTSPYGLEDSMHGRYAYISDNYALCNHGIKIMEKVLKKLDIQIPRILALSDRSSQILAHAASQIMELPLANWIDVSLQTPGLIVCYDLDRIQSSEVITEISEHRPQQILWGHASCWTNPFPFSPDITTFLYQHNVAPWARGHMIYNSETNNVNLSESDESAVQKLAKKIIKSEGAANFDDNLEDIIKLVQSVSDLDEKSTIGLYRSKGSRYHQRAGSPVKSNRFF